MLSNQIIRYSREYPTPFYVYDLSCLKSNLMEVTALAEKYQFKVHYAVKANSNTPILNEISKFGLGADCVSGNEILHAINHGFDPSEIVFAGVGKSDIEINIALDHDIFAFNCESLPELEVIEELARLKGKKASVFIRVNPNVNANTHHYITTGLEENKFGINFNDIPKVLERFKSNETIELMGLHVHIGSQITDMEVFKGLCIRLNELQDYIEDQGFYLQHLNVGGGLGVNYNEPDQSACFEEYFSIFHQFLNRRPSQSIHFELGRSIVGNCGSLISSVLYVKEGISKNFAILDAGMTELLRPALYQAYHKIEILTENSSELEYEEKYDVVGPICESSDSFAKSIMLPKLKRGSIIAVRTAGAYGEVMSSTYNLRDKVKAYYF